MEELKQILKWGTWSLYVLMTLSLSISIASGYGVEFGLMPYMGIAYLVIIATIIAILIISLIGVQRRINQEKEHDLQQEALKEKHARESAKVAYDKEDREHRWKLENEDRERKFKLEDKDRARKITIEDEDRKRKWKLEDEDRAKKSDKKSDEETK
ncbi:MAG: hypothetical protein R3Y04_03940 [Rikenellaceae bacterium]